MKKILLVLFIVCVLIIPAYGERMFSFNYSPIVSFRSNQLSSAEEFISIGSGLVSEVSITCHAAKRAVDWSQSSGGIDFVIRPSGFVGEQIFVSFSGLDANEAYSLFAKKNVDLYNLTEFRVILIRGVGWKNDESIVYDAFISFVSQDFDIAFFPSEMGRRVWKRNSAFQSAREVGLVLEEGANLVIFDQSKV